MPIPKLTISACYRTVGQSSSLVGIITIYFFILKTRAGAKRRGDSPPPPPMIYFLLVSSAVSHVGILMVIITLYTPFFSGRNIQMCRSPPDLNDFFRTGAESRHFATPTKHPGAAPVLNVLDLKSIYWIMITNMTKIG